MFPKILDLGRVDLPLFGEVDLVLPTYGMLFAASALVAWIWFVRRGRSLGIAEETLFNLSFYSLLAGLLGAKALLVLLDLEFYLSHPRELLGSLRSAGVLIGGVLGGAIAFVVYARRQGLPLLLLGDAVAAPLAAAQAVGRLGCFAAGCCYGKRAGGDAWWTLTFDSPYAHEHTGVPLHVPLIPIQLLQFAADLALAGVLTWLWRKRLKPEGSVFWCYLIFYGVSRGVLEFWRGDVSRGMWLDGRLSTSQSLAIVGIAFGLYMLWRGRRTSTADAA